MSNRIMSTYEIENAIVITCLYCLYYKLRKYGINARNMHVNYVLGLPDLMRGTAGTPTLDERGQQN